jgi:membrane-bound metal-dependent hydrolase YbcI (DUF457 family)
MAGFQTHLTVSTVTGVAYGVGAYTVFNVPPSACILAGGLCSVSGMLPDIDSGPGRPLRESLAFAAAVISTMLADRFRMFHLSADTIVLACAATYLLVRFGLSKLLQLYTVHRGMFHSLPAAIIFGELAFLLSAGEVSLRWYKAGAVVLGYLSHLVLDELYSVGVKRGRMTLKKSFGSALKVFGRGWMPNLSAYTKLAILTCLVVYEPAWTAQRAAADHLDQAMAQLFDAMFLESEQALAQQEAAPGEAVAGPGAAPNARPEAGLPQPTRTTGRPAGEDVRQSRTPFGEGIDWKR